MPFKLIRRKETVTKKIKDKLTQGESWVVHITTGGDWGIKAIEAVERMALPDVVDVEPEDVTSYEPDPIETDFPQLPPIAGQLTPMPYDQAAKITMKGKGNTVSRLVDLDRAQLEWVVSYDKATPEQKDAARTILIVDHGVQA